MMKILLKMNSLKTIFLLGIVLGFSINTNGQNALNFDGVDDFVSATTFIAIDGNEERTVEAWIQTTDSGAQHIVGWGILQTGRRFDIRLEDSYLRLELENGFIKGLNTILNDGEWHHIAVVVPPGAIIVDEVLMYIDGVLEPHTEHPREIETINAKISIGSNSLIPDREFHGKIDEVRIWNFARTQEEIIQYMSNELCDNSGLAARYSFEDGIAYDDNTGIVTVLDQITGEGSELLNFGLTDTVSNFVDGVIFQGVTGTDVQVSCGPFTWIDGITYDSSNDTAMFVIEGGASNTCDSVVTLNLTIVNANVTTVDPTITADFSGATYQWLDCDNGLAEIPNETDQSFTATENGSYALEITFEGCTLTSECVDIITIGVEENDIFESTSIYPNPNLGEVNIKLGELNYVDISIIDITGKSVYKVSNVRTKNYKFNLDAPAGMYLIELKSEGKYQNFRLVVQN